VSACAAAVQVRPDAKLAGELEAAETARLEAARNAMSPEELEAAVRETEELRRRQARRGWALHLTVSFSCKCKCATARCVLCRIQRVYGRTTEAHVFYKFTC
jgi:isopropylmalate/homocitrate/citramalate synthase